MVQMLRVVQRRLRQQGLAVGPERTGLDDVLLQTVALVQLVERLVAQVALRVLIEDELAGVGAEGVPTPACSLIRAVVMSMRGKIVGIWQTRHSGGRVSNRASVLPQSFGIGAAPDSPPRRSRSCRTSLGTCSRTTRSQHR